MSVSAQIDRRRALLDRLLDRSLDRSLDAGSARVHDVAPIPARADGAAAPLSFSQERFWFLDRLAPGNPFYIESMAVPLPAASVSAGVLEQAINAVVRRHEILRTSFRDSDGGPLQVVAQELYVPLASVDLSALDDAARETQTSRLLQEQATRPFDLAVAPLLRTLLIKRGTAGHIFSLALHHIISDGWSMRVFSREVSALAAALTVGRPVDLAPLPIQYGDFAVWQRSNAGDSRGVRALDYWREQLRDLPRLELPLDFPRPHVLGYHGAHLDLHLPPNVSAGLRALAARQRATLFMTALAAFAAVLGRHSGQEDIVIGAPVAGRSRSELEPLIGLFLNTIVLRIDLSGNPCFRTLLSRVRKTALAAFDRQHTPFEALVEALHPERELGRNPLFQVLFQFFTPQDEKAGAAKDQDETIAVDKGAAILDLSFHLWDSPKGIAARLEYSTELFQEATIRRLFEHFSNFLSAAVTAPERPISDLQMFAPKERRRIVAASRGAITETHEPPTLLAAFAQRVASGPRKIAFVAGDRRTTYTDLSRRAAQMAALLAGKGATRGDRVVVCLQRSVDSIAAMLGAMQLGAAFVPVDPAYPPARVRYIVADSGARVIVTSTAHRGYAGNAACLEVDDPAVAQLLATGEETVAERLGPALDVAYAIYTSGSTGQPKGVMGTHQATLNRCAWMWRAFPFAADELACHKTAIAFVDSIWEIFGPLLAGVPSVIVTEDAARDPRALCATLGEHGVTRLLLVPSLLQAVLDTRIDLRRVMPCLRLCFTSGERLSGDLAARFAEAAPRDMRLVNLYGSSEVAGDITCAVLHECVAQTDPPIGLPLDNCATYVLDRHLELVPDGTTGDLYVSGSNLARGYLGRPAMTAERFVPNPYAEVPGERLFATGDRVKRMADGNLVFQGRSDHQVKLRGHRIELGEVEMALRTHPGVAQAVATVTGDDAGGRIDAWITSADECDAALDAADVRRFVARSLPVFMLPATLTVLDALPLTPNGKVDRLALSIGETNGAAAAVAPKTEVEQALASLWSELLGRTAIGATDNFFEIGGHSLLATRLITQIRDRFGVELPLTAVFLNPTIAELGSQVEAILIAEIDDLTDTEVRTLLNERKDGDDQRGY